MLNITNFYNMIEQGTTGGYNPLGSSKLIESWLSYAGTTTDGGGLVSAWEGQKAGKNFTAAIAAKQPTLTATKFGTLPGLVFDGIGNVMRCLTVGALISGNTSLTVIMVLFSPGTGDEIHSEFATTSWFTEAGTWTMASVATNTVIAACRGDVGNVIWTGNDNVAPLVVPGILTSTFNFTLATNEALPMELDNVVLAGTYSTNSNNTSTLFPEIPYCI